MIWKHYDEQGNVIGEIRRIIQVDGTKVDIPYYRDSVWGFGSGIPDSKKPLPPFGLESVRNWDSIIIIAEGQKCVKKWNQLGFQCLSGVCGCGYAKRIDWGCLKKAKEVWFSPDNDTPGWKYVDDIASILTQLNPIIKLFIIPLPLLPPKGDICDINCDIVRGWKGWFPRIPYIREKAPPPPLNPPKKTLYPEPNTALLEHRSLLIPYVSNDITLSRMGSGWKGCCPFHDDKRASFTITPNGFWWKCWAGCGEGSVYDYVMKRDGVGFREALEIIKQKKTPPWRKREG